MTLKLNTHPIQNKLKVAAKRDYVIGIFKQKLKADYDAPPLVETIELRMMFNSINLTLSPVC